MGLGEFLPPPLCISCGTLENFELLHPYICGNMKEYAENMNKYLENTKKYMKNMKKYVRNMKEYVGINMKEYEGICEESEGI